MINPNLSIPDPYRSISTTLSPSQPQPPFPIAILSRISQSTPIPFYSIPLPSSFSTPIPSISVVVGRLAVA